MSSKKSPKTIGQTLSDNIVILDVVYHCPGRTRTDRGVEYKTEANSAWFTTQKDLFKSDTYTAAQKIQWDTQEWLKRRSIPCGLTGYYAIPVSLVSEVEAYMAERDTILKAKVEEFVAEYEQLRKTAEENLKDRFEPQRYPTPGYFRRGFWMERKYVELQIPSAKKLGSELAEKSKTAAQQRMDDAANEVIWVLREQFSQLVSSLTDSIKGTGPDGKKRVLTDAALQRAIEWFELFGKRNVLGDDDLNKLVNTTKAILGGKSAGECKTNEGFKAEVATKMAEVRKTIDELMVNKPARRISFDD